MRKTNGYAERASVTFIAAFGNQDAAVVDKSGSLQFSARRHALP